VRDCRIYQTQKLTFGFGRVVENSLRNVLESHHNVLFAFFVVADVALFKLEEFEGWHVLFIDIAHALEVFNNIVQI